MNNKTKIFIKKNLFQIEFSKRELLTLRLSTYTISHINHLKMSFSSSKLTELIGFYNIDDLFTNDKCLGSGKQLDTINYRWICKCDITIRRMIATQILYNGEYLWIFTNQGLQKFYKILMNNLKKFIKIQEQDIEKKKKLIATYNRLKYNLPNDDYFDIEIVATNDAKYYDKKRQQMYWEQECLLRSHLQVFYNKPIIHRDDIMEIRKYDIGLELYRNLSTCDIIHDDGVIVDLPSNMIQMKFGKIVSYPSYYNECRRKKMDENMDDMDCVSSC